MPLFPHYSSYSSSSLPPIPPNYNKNKMSVASVPAGTEGAVLHKVQETLIEGVTTSMPSKTIVDAIRTVRLISYKLLETSSIWGCSSP